MVCWAKPLDRISDLLRRGVPFVRIGLHLAHLLSPTAGEVRSLGHY